MISFECSISGERWPSTPSERIWAEASDCPAGEPPQAAVADVRMTGLDLDDFRAAWVLRP
jgi:hypothetical protein